MVRGPRDAALRRASRSSVPLPFSTTWRAPEDPLVLKQRIDEAARLDPKERFALATLCGFAYASETAARRLITDEVQAAS
jgi:hypothetical protein